MMKWSKQRKHEILMQVTNNLLDTVETTEPDLKKVVDDAGNIICYICDICKAIFADTTGSPRYLHVRVCRGKQAAAQQQALQSEPASGSSSGEPLDIKQEYSQVGSDHFWGLGDEGEFEGGSLTEGDDVTALIAGSSNSRKRPASTGAESTRKQPRTDVESEFSMFDQLCRDLDTSGAKSSTFSAGESRILQILQSQASQIKSMCTTINNLNNRLDMFITQENRRHSTILREISSIKGAPESSDSDPQSDNTLPSVKNSITEDFTPSYQFISLKRVVELRHCAVLDERLFATSVSQAIMDLEDYLTYTKPMSTPKLTELRKILCTFGKVTTEEELAAKEDMIHRILDAKKRSLVTRFQHCAKQSPINFAIGSNLLVVAPAVEVEGRYYPRDGSAHYAHKFDDKDELLSPFPALARSEDGLQQVKSVFICQRIVGIREKFTFKMLSFDDFTVSDLVV